MKFNPAIHHRRSIRLKNYDYSKAGAYFITLCVQDRELYFEEFSELKNIVNEQWHKIPERFENAGIDEFVIMLDHVHGILIIDWLDGAEASPARTGADVKPRDGADIKPRDGADVKPARTGAKLVQKSPTIGDVVCAFKSLCAMDWLKYIKVNDINAKSKFWQRNYYESIIRDERHLNNVRTYIRNNPLKWEIDQMHNSRR